MRLLSLFKRPLVDLSIYGVASRHRKAVLNGEKAAVARLNASYNDARKAVKVELRATILKVQEAMKAGLPVSMAWTNDVARLKQALHTIELQVATFAGDAAKIALAQQKLSVLLGLKHSEELMKSAISGSFTVLNIGAFEDIIGFTAPGSPLYDLFKGMGPEAVAGARGVFAKGIAMGWGPQVMARELDDVLGIPYKRALLITRTESNRARRTATLRNYQANDKLLKGWEWSAALSPRTCAVCLARDGTIHNLDEQMATHPACRCAMIPVLLKGHVRGKETGAEYFHKLSPAQQDKILGKRKGEMYRAGEIDLKLNTYLDRGGKWGPSYKTRSLKNLELMAQQFPPKPFAPVTGPQAPPVKKSAQGVLDRLRELEDAKSAPLSDGLQDPVGVVLGGTQTGAAAGSNAGGFYTGTDGRAYYVKLYDDPAQANGEHLANEIYRRLGLHAPESAVVEHQGKHVYVSEILDNYGTLGSSFSKAEAEAVMRGFAADCLVANWDAVGMTYDNIVKLTGGGIARIDNGGSFLMRARAGRKPVDRLSGLAEWDVFLSAKNPQYQAVAAKAGIHTAEDMRVEVFRQIKAIEKLRSDSGGWGSFVEQTVPNLAQADKDAIVKMLDERTHELKKKRASMIVSRRLKRTGKRAPLVEKNFTITDMQKIEASWGGSHAAGWHGPHKEYYAGDKAHYDEIAVTTGSWCGSSSGTEGTKFIAALKELGEGKNTVGAKYAARVIGTRKARWENLARHHGLGEVPTSFTAYRGMGGKSVRNDAVAAWLDTTSPFMRAKTRTASSWSMSENVANGFGGGEVIYKAQIPFENTFFDKWLDDHRFVTSYGSEQEIVCGGLMDDAIVCNKADVTIKYGGKRYTYAERQQLFDAMTRNGETLPKPKGITTPKKAPAKKKPPAP